MKDHPKMVAIKKLKKNCKNTSEEIVDTFWNGSHAMTLWCPSDLKDNS